MNKLSLLAGILSIFLFSTYTIFGKLLLDNFSSETLTAVSQGFAALAVLLFFGFMPELKKLKKLSLKGKFALLAIAIFSALILPVLFLKGLALTTATNAIILKCLGPVFASAIAVLWLKEDITPRQIGGAALMLFGVLFIVTKVFTAGFSLNLGDLLVLGSTLSGAISTNIFKKYLHKIDPELVVLFRNIIGALVLAFVFPFLFDVVHDTTALFDGKIFILLASFSLIAIATPQLLWYKSLEVLPTSLISSLGLLNPVFGVILAVLILDEAVSWFHYVGGCIVFLGLYFTLSHQQNHPEHKKHLKLHHFGGH